MSSMRASKSLGHLHLNRIANQLRARVLQETLDLRIDQGSFPVVSGAVRVGNASRSDDADRTTCPRPTFRYKPN